MGFDNFTYTYSNILLTETSCQREETVISVLLFLLALVTDFLNSTCCYNFFSAILVGKLAVVVHPTKSRLLYFLLRIKDTKERTCSKLGIRV